MTRPIPQSAWRQLQQAAEQQDGFATTLLGQTIVDEASLDSELAAGIRLVQFAADVKNVLWAKCLMLYMRSCEGFNTPLEHYALVDSDATSQLEIYAERGNPWAQTVLGSLLYQGKTTPQNRTYAIQLLGRAADGGCLWAKVLMKEYGISSVQYVAEKALARMRSINEQYRIK